MVLSIGTFLWFKKKKGPRSGGFSLFTLPSVSIVPFFSIVPLHSDCIILLCDCNDPHGLLCCRMGDTGDVALARHEGRGSEGFLEHVYKHAAKELFGVDVQEITYKNLRLAVRQP